MKINLFECDECKQTIEQEKALNAWACLYVPNHYMNEGVMINVTVEKHFCSNNCLGNWTKENLPSI